MLDVKGYFVGANDSDHRDHSRDSGRDRPQGERHASDQTTRTCSCSRPAPRSDTDHASGTDWGTTRRQRSTYGSATDLWGTTWTPAQINASNFGVRLRVGNGHTSSRTASIDRDPRSPSRTPPIRRRRSGARRARSSGPTSAAPARSTPGPRGQPARTRTASTRRRSRRAAAARQAADRSRLVVGEREARPEAPVHRGRQHLPEHVRQRRRRRRAAPEQQRRRLGRDHADELELHVPGEGERGARGRDLLEQRDPRAQDLRARSTSTATCASTTTARSSTTRAAAIIYASDDIEFDERVCAGGSGMTNCAASAATMSAWNPSTDLLTILAGNKDTNQPVLENGPPVVYQQNAEFDHSTQGTNSSQGDDPAQPGAFQGIVYAKGNCQVHEFFKLSGPVICNQIQINDGIETGLPDVLGVPAARLARRRPGLPQSRQHRRRSR